MTGFTLAAVLRIPPEGVADFQAYEAQVLPLIARHGGKLQRRLRNRDGTLECHVMWFANRAGFDSFKTDPLRARAAPLLARSGAIAEVHEMIDLEVAS